MSLWTAWDDLFAIQLEAASLLALWVISDACEETLPGPE